jgi:hypothetical protein
MRTLARSSARHLILTCRSLMILVVAAILSSCAAGPGEMTDPTPQVSLQGVDFRTLDANQALDLLARADGIGVQLSLVRGKSSIGTDAAESNGLIGPISTRDVSWCNGGNSYGYPPDDPREFTCLMLPLRSFDVDPSVLEFDMEALFRACGVYASNDQRDNGTSCGLLGWVFYKLGNLAVARAIWEQAPGCVGPISGSGTDFDGCAKAVFGYGGGSLSAEFSVATRIKTLPDQYGICQPHDCPGDPSAVSAYARDRSALLSLAHRACATQYSAPDAGGSPEPMAPLDSACAFLNQQGASVDMAGAEEAQDRVDADRTQSRADEQEAKHEAYEEKQARFNTLMDTLHGMPGGSDPNAVIDAANSQPMQAASSTPAPQTAGTAVQSTQDDLTTNYPSELCPNMQAYPDSGARCNPVISENACVTVVSNTWIPPTATGAGSLTLALKNVCMQPIRLSVSGPPDGSNTGELTNVPSGQTYVFANDRSAWSYKADDGTDCFGNTLRPGCSGR